MDGRGIKHGTLPSLCSITVVIIHLVFFLTLENFYSLLLPMPACLMGSPDTVLLRTMYLPAYLVVVA